MNRDLQAEAARGRAAQFGGFKAKYQKRYPQAIRSLCEDEEHLLTFYAFPPVMHRYIRRTNASLVESCLSNVRQRTDQIDAFTTETCGLTIVWVVMQDIHLPRIPVSSEVRRIAAGSNTQSERLGQRKVAFVMALAPRVDAILAIFLVLGIASGLPCGAIMALPTQVLVPETRSVGMGIMFTVYYGVNVCGPWLIGLIANQAGSARFAFDSSAISLCVAVPLWLFFRQLASRPAQTAVPNLASLNDRALRDIGIDRATVENDSTASFWRHR